jgi:hypothetical protein
MAIVLRGVVELLSEILVDSKAPRLSGPALAEACPQPVETKRGAGQCRAHGEAALSGDGLIP